MLAVALPEGFMRLAWVELALLYLALAALAQALARALLAAILSRSCMGEATLLWLPPLPRLVLRVELPRAACRGR